MKRSLLLLLLLILSPVVAAGCTSLMGVTDVPDVQDGGEGGSSPEAEPDAAGPAEAGEEATVNDAFSGGDTGSE